MNALRCDGHDHSFTLTTNRAIAGERFSATLAVSLPGHGHSVFVDGVFFNADGAAGNEQVLGGLQLATGAARCHLQWRATSASVDGDKDGWSEAGEAALGSSDADPAKTPEHETVPVTAASGPSVCRDFADNDGDTRLDATEADGPDLNALADCARPAASLVPPVTFGGPYSGADAGPLSLRVVGTTVRNVTASGVTCDAHNHALNLPTNIPIIGNRFSVTGLSVPTTGHTHALDIDGVLYDGDGDGRLEQVVGAFVLVSATTRCKLKYHGTAIGPDSDGDGFADPAERRLGSLETNAARTPEHLVVPTTSLFGNGPCEDLVDNDADLKKDAAEADGPDEFGALDCALAFGVTLSRALTTTSEVDKYTFVAGAGEILLIRAQADVVDPRVSIFSPGGTATCPTAVASGFLEFTCTTSIAGTHVIFFADGGTKETGAYNMYFQRLNPPVGAKAFAYGATHTATLNAQAETQVWSVANAANDRLLLRIRDDGGPLDPRVDVFDSAGTRVCGDSTPNALVELECRLVKAGPHRIFVSDLNGNETGFFWLHMQRLNRPAGAAPIALGQTIESAIPARTTTKAFSFDGVLNSRVLVRVSDFGTTKAPVDPKVSLLNPGGVAICSGAQATNALEDYVELQCQLKVTGKHAILVMDQGGEDVGSFGVYVQNLTAPAGATALTLGEPKDGSIDKRPEADFYTFTGAKDDLLFVSLADTSGFDPLVAIFGPDGSQVCRGEDSDNLVEFPCTLTTSGQHKVMAADGKGNETGAYTLTVQ